MSINNLAKRRQAPFRDRPDPARLGAQGARPLSGCRAWLITDDKVGMAVQCAGVARALGVAAEAKRVAPSAPWRWLAPWGPVDPRDRFGRPGSTFAPPWPDIAIASGRQSIPYLRALRGAAEERTFTVVIQDPRTGAGSADLICVPAHDRIAGKDTTGANVFATLTAPHGLSPALLAELRAAPPREIAALPTPRVTVALGGPNGAYRFGPEAERRLAGALGSLKDLGASFLITSSRRTPAALLAAVRQVTEGAPRLVWEGEGDNPYARFLAHADLLIVTADSVNMTSEACATGRPVHVFEPDGGSDKFTRFHEALRRYGATRPLPERIDRLERWDYAPLDSAAAIAREIERRWLARAAASGE